MPIAAAFLLLCALPIAGAIVIALTAMGMHHRRKMAELRVKEHRLIDDDIRGEFEKIRNEIRDLRDVSTQYDISFDTALQQVERRLSHLERPDHVQPTKTESAEQTVQTRTY